LIYQDHPKDFFRENHSISQYATKVIYRDTAVFWATPSNDRNTIDGGHPKKWQLQ